MGDGVESTGGRRWGGGRGSGGILEWVRLTLAGGGCRREPVPLGPAQMPAGWPPRSTRGPGRDRGRASAGREAGARAGPRRMREPAYDRAASQQLPDVLKGEVREQFGQSHLHRGRAERRAAEEGRTCTPSSSRGRSSAAWACTARWSRHERPAWTASRPRPTCCSAPRWPTTIKDTPRLSGIRELYLLLTGDYDFHGAYPQRARAAVERHDHHGDQRGQERHERGDVGLLQHEPAGGGRRSRTKRTSPRWTKSPG